MATYTANYGLHQWVPEDNFLRSDFNEDFQKIDAGLHAAKSLADQLEAEKSGIVTGSYTGDGADTPLLMEVAGDAAEGVLVSTHCSFENDDPVVQDFVTLYTETQGTEPENAFAALGYDCAHVIATAIEMCGDDVTPANVRDNLEQIQDLRCVTGVISYSAESHVPQKSATINVVENGAFSFVAELNP